MPDMTAVENVDGKSILDTKQRVSPARDLTLFYHIVNASWPVERVLAGCFYQ